MFLLLADLELQTQVCVGGPNGVPETVNCETIRQNNRDKQFKQDRQWTGLRCFIGSIAWLDPVMSPWQH